MKKHVLAALAASFIAACAGHYIRMDVRAYSSGPELLGVKSFATLSIGECQKNELLETQILELVTQRLSAKGLRHSPGAPEVYVTVTCSMETSETYEPERIEYIQSVNVVTGEPIMVPVKKGGIRREHDRYISVHVFRLKDDGVQRLWMGEVDGSGSTAGILVVAPALLDEIFSEFTVRSSKPTIRIVKWSPPKAQQ